MISKSMIDLMKTVAILENVGRGGKSNNLPYLPNVRWVSN